MEVEHQQIINNGEGAEEENVSDHQDMFLTDEENGEEDGGDSTQAPLIHERMEFIRTDIGEHLKCFLRATNTT